MIQASPPEEPVALTVPELFVVAPSPVPTIVEMDALPDAEVTVPELIVIPRRSSDFVFIQASPVAPLALTIPELFVVALKKPPDVSIQALPVEELIVPELFAVASPPKV